MVCPAGHCMSSFFIPRHRAAVAAFIRRPSRALTALLAGSLLLTAAALRADDLDSGIAAAAAQSYVFQHYLKDETITVMAQNGVATLTGVVAEANHLALAQDTVAGLPGVKSVVNLLKVDGVPPMEHSDRWLRLNVKAVLEFDRSLGISATAVLIEGGVVTLRGEAASEAQKELTTAYVNDIRGVVELRNNMTVAASAANSTTSPNVIMDDASITALVKAVLRAHQSTCEISTAVQTAEGVATVSGVAQNLAEQNQVTRLVSGTKGVIKVNNTVTIKAPLGNHD